MFSFRRLLAGVLVAGLLAQSSPFSVTAQEVTEQITVPSSSTIAVLIELTAPSALQVYASTLKQPGRNGLTPRQNAINAGRTQVAIASAQQNQLASRLSASQFGVSEIYRVQKVMNAVAANVNPSSIAGIRAFGHCRT